MGKIIRGTTLSGAHPGMGIIPASGSCVFFFNKITFIK